MRALLNTNVLLDVLLDREPFSTQSAQVLSRAERGEISGYACATTVTTIFYLCSRASGRRQARRHVETLLSILDVAPVNRRVIEAALASRFKDFEDAVVSESAALVSADTIVTRNNGISWRRQYPCILLASCLTCSTRTRFRVRSESLGNSRHSDGRPDHLIRLRIRRCLAERGRPVQLL